VRSKPCWECKRDLAKKSRLTFNTKYGPVTKTSAYTSGYADSEQMTPDHQPPISTAWENGGCHMKPEEFKTWANAVGTVKPHCKYHSKSQSGTIQGADAKEAISDYLSDLDL
jgi:hypothetical protein